ncbi:MAG TPA: tRNA preQ1(34) S-adenosylmethionine ribosyltransferase-isomerase QueA [Syntrophales bacterium]|mgnify:CR=1 FL=1|nr:tRNA preQ1(34) S-adenosylmethionine ribosyltransferase-isomerase QueA [Syntrophales bacterium]
MKLSDFDYFLPRSAIAQYPLEERDASRMMVIKRAEKSISHHLFGEIDTFVMPGDVLVVNDSRVIPARLYGWKETGGKVELLLLKKHREERLAEIWDVLVRPARRVKVGTLIQLGEKAVAKVIERVDGKKWRLAFSVEGPFDKFLEAMGNVPLPPYIKRKDTPDDRARYQTIFAARPGSVAAPTAGFHFSSRILEKIEARGAKVVPITLHVGYGTFLPIETEEVEDHRMEEEWYAVSERAAAEINKARRVIAIGTTSARVIETVSDEKGVVRAGEGTTSLFIYPGYRFKRVDAMLTNFHLPRSSLLLMAAAFIGRDLLLTAYRLAVETGYRFYSYGDCTLLLP